jgi:hypothetical protein
MNNCIYKNNILTVKNVQKLKMFIYHYLFYLSKDLKIIYEGITYTLQYLVDVVTFFLYVIFVFRSNRPVKFVKIKDRRENKK